MNSISVEDCNILRCSAGWPQMHFEQMKTGLENSEFIVVARDNDTTVGMARIVSDGGYVYFIVDVLVLPEYQRKGIGKTMMNNIMEYIYSKLKDGFCIQVDLLASKGKEKFYEAFGFISRPDSVYGCGMTQRITKNSNHCMV